MEKQTAVTARKSTDKRFKVRVAIQDYRRDKNGKGHYNEVPGSAVIIEFPAALSKTALSVLVKRIQESIQAAAPNAK